MATVYLFSITDFPELRTQKPKAVIKINRDLNTVEDLLDKAAAEIG